MLAGTSSWCRAYTSEEEAEQPISPNLFSKVGGKDVPSSSSRCRTPGLVHPVASQGGRGERVFRAGLGGEG